MLPRATISVPTSTDLSEKRDIFNECVIEAATGCVLCNKMNSLRDPALYRRYLPQK